MLGIRLILLILIFPLLLNGVTVTLDPTPVPRYHVLEIAFEDNAATSNPYERHVQAVFISPNRIETTVNGFYDGARQWKIRFMPDQIGRWQVRWRFDNTTGVSDFSCTLETHPKIHGHIRIDPQNPRKLRYEDGTPLFWHGGKYLCIMRPFGTDDLQELSYPERLDTQTYLALCNKYFQDISQLGLNGAVFKVQVLPLDFNLREMDLAFFKAMDEIVKSAMWNGINLQVTLFDVWGKRKQNTDWSLLTPLSADWLLLEPWNEYTFSSETKFYLEYIINRYAAFPNLVWELWNEAEKFKISASSATQTYLRIIRQADPYDLLIGASEMYTAPYGLDLCHPHLRYKCWPDQWDFMYWAIHNDKRYAPYYFKYEMPYIWNEIGPWENDATHIYSEQDYRNWHRAMFWSALTLGAAGISEEHWSDIRALPNEITRQHSFFIRFVNQLYDFNALQPSDQIKLLNGKGFLCRRSDDELVAYLFTQQDKSRIEFDLYLGKSSIAYRYYNPKTGEWHNNSTRYDASSEGWHRFKTPMFDQDIVFYAVKANDSSPTPVEWGKLEAQIKGDTVLLYWQTLCESNNLGFEIYRRLGSGPLQKIGFVPGAGTINEPREYVFAYRPPFAAQWTFIIRQIDTDGSSQEQTLQADLSPADTVPYPNPANGYVIFPGPSVKEAVRIDIFDTLGRLIWRGNWIECPFIWEGDTISGEQVPSGIYFYFIRSAETGRLLSKGKISFVH